MGFHCNRKAAGQMTKRSVLARNSLMTDLGLSDSPYEKTAKDRIKKGIRAKCLIPLSNVSIHGVFEFHGKFYVPIGNQNRGHFLCRAW